TQARLARSRALAATALTQLTSNPLLSLVAARQAAQLEQTKETEDVLRRSLLESRLRRVLPSHSSTDAGAVFSKNRSMVVTAGAPVRVFRLDSPARAAALSADGTLVATVGRDRFVRVFSLSSERLRYDLEQRGRVTSAVFSPKGLVLATTGVDRRAYLWDTRSGTLLHSLSGHRGPVVSASFSLRGSLLVTASKDGTALVWTVATGRHVAQ